MTVWEVLALLCGLVLLVGTARLMYYVVRRQTGTLPPRPRGSTFRTKLGYAFPLLGGIVLSVASVAARLADATILGFVLCFACTSFLLFLTVMSGFLLSERTRASDASHPYQWIILDPRDEALLGLLLLIALVGSIVIGIHATSDTGDLERRAQRLEQEASLADAAGDRDKADELWGEIRGIRDNMEASERD